MRVGRRAEEHARGRVDEAEGDDGAEGDAAERAAGGPSRMTRRAW